jgi:hypothetical protein
MPNLAAFPAAPEETVPKTAVSSPAGLTIERRPLAACAAIETEWRDLAGRAIELNPFCEPDFALPAAQHLVDFRDVSVLLFWDGPTAPRRLVGFVPARLRRRLLGQDELIGWNNPRLGLATPLIDIDQVERVVAALLHAPGRWGLADTQTLQLSRLDLDGPLLHGLLQAAQRTSHAAAIEPASAPASPATPDLAALRHGLSRHGKLSFAESASRQDLRDMVELHLALEASGSLARAGGAALQDIRESAFLRAMTRNLARGPSLPGRPAEPRRQAGRGRNPDRQEPAPLALFGRAGRALRQLRPVGPARRLARPSRPPARDSRRAARPPRRHAAAAPR